jgi:hypothetical protein
MQFAAGGVVLWHHSFFVMALGGVMLSASRLGCFTPDKVASVPIQQKAECAPDLV